MAIEVVPYPTLEEVKAADLAQLRYWNWNLRLAVTPDEIEVISAILAGIRMLKETGVASA